jgi:hypothetical protein
MCGYGPSRVFKVKPKKTLLISNLKMGKLERWQSWPIASVLKTEDLVRDPWVRILLSPQVVFFSPTHTWDWLFDVKEDN